MSRSNSIHIHPQSNKYPFTDLPHSQISTKQDSSHPQPNPAFTTAEASTPTLNRPSNPHTHTGCDLVQLQVQQAVQKVLQIQTTRFHRSTLSTLTNPPSSSSSTLTHTESDPPLSLTHPQLDSSTTLTNPPLYSSTALHHESDPAITTIEHQSLPLTAKNLRIHTGKDMAEPVTPSTSSKNTGPGPLNSQKSLNVQGIRLVMKNNNMPVEDSNAIRNNPEVRKRALEIIDQTRNSPVKPEWQADLTEVRDQYAVRNEMTWIHKFWNAFQNLERNVKEKDKHGSLLEPTVWKAVAWAKSFLDDNWSADLRTGSVPVLHSDEPNIQELLASLPRVTNPRPDIAFGLKEQAFSKAENVVNDRYQMYSQVSQGIYHCFLIVETKSIGAIGEAEHQACRGGASLVCATRRMVGDSDPHRMTTSTGPDMASIAFSIALVPTVANIFCHWAEVNSTDPVIYHMHLIRSFAIREEDQASAFHRAVNNILDWGTDDRKTQMQEVLNKIHDLTAQAGSNKRKDANE